MLDFFMHLYENLKQYPSTFEGYPVLLLDSLGEESQAVLHSQVINTHLASL